MHSYTDTDRYIAMGRVVAICIIIPVLGDSHAWEHFHQVAIYIRSLKSLCEVCILWLTKTLDTKISVLTPSGEQLHKLSTYIHTQIGNYV